MTYRLLFALLLAGVVAAVPASAQQSTIVINELMASNRSVLADEHGGYDDWVELYNAGSDTVDVAGFYVSDDSTAPARWQIPAGEAVTRVAPGAYLLLWFDGEPEQGPLHVEPRLSADGEYVALTAADGSTVIDAVRYEALASDVSFGRAADAAETWTTFEPSTPGAPNETQHVAPQVEAPVFSRISGFYRGSQSVSVQSTAPEAATYVTRDGSVPVEADSLLYRNPLTVDTTTVLRARSFASGHRPSEVVTTTLLIDEETEMSVVSLVSDPAGLFDEEAGIYVKGDGAEDEWPYRGANFWQPWVRPAHIEYFTPTKQLGFEIDAAMEIGGQFSRAFPKKTFNVNTEAGYGVSKLEYPLFADNDYDEYDGFTLRAGAEDRSRLHNELVYLVNRRVGMASDMQAYEPCLLFVNGRYWGIYNLVERKDDDFVQARYGVDDIDMIKDWNKVVDGTIDAYASFLDWLNAHDVTQDTVYRQVTERMNVESFIDHWILHLYTAHGDVNNTRTWRARRPDGRWHWISYDFDWWRDVEEETLARLTEHTTAEGYRLLGYLVQNTTFRDRFVNRLADLLGTALQPEVLLPAADSLAGVVEPELPRDLDRWSVWEDISGPQTYTMGHWAWSRQWLADFVTRRPAILGEQVVDRFGLPGTFTLSVEADDGGAVRVNTVGARDAYEATYFQGVPVAVTAEPEAGYRFAGWSGDALGDERVLTVEAAGDVALQAAFTPIEATVVINEINYRAAADFDTEDWVELYNPSEQHLDVSGWVFKDDDDAHTFTLPAGTELAPEGYLVLCRDAAAFAAAGIEDVPCVGDVGFGLSSGGDAVRIYDAEGRLVDAVTYGATAPWPEAPDGTGATLALRDPLLDNSRAEHWAAAEAHGTPGRSNTSGTGRVADAAERPAAFQLRGNYPNPFRGATTISYALATPVPVRVQVYDVVGRVVADVSEAPSQPGVHTVTVDASALAAGVYLYRVEAGSEAATGRMVVLP